MIKNFDDYESFIKEILKRLPIIHIEQLIISLQKSFEGITRQKAISILKDIQKHGYILLSSNDWAMTKSAYKSLTNDRYFDGITFNSDVRLPDKLNIYDKKSVKDKDDFIVEKRGVIDTRNIEELLEKTYLNKLDCFWIVADMMPYSENFFFGEYPWTVIFNKNPESEDVGALYEIIKMPKNNFRIHCEMLKRIPKVDEEDIKNSIKRIVVIDSEDDIDSIPLVGVSHICILDHTEDTHYKVLKKIDKKEQWSYYNE